MILKGFPHANILSFSEASWLLANMTNPGNKIFAKDMCKECKVLTSSTDLRTLQTTCHSSVSLWMSPLNIQYIFKPKGMVN